MGSSVNFIYNIKYRLLAWFFVLLLSLLFMPNSVWGATQVTLGWEASTDDVGVDHYEVERCDGIDCITFGLIGMTPQIGYIDSTIVWDTSYSYRVRAVDAAGNRSDYSNTATTILVSTFEFSVSRAGTGSGTVTSSPAGID